MTGFAASPQAKLPLGWGYLLTFAMALSTGFRLTWFKKPVRWFRAPSAARLAETERMSLISCFIPAVTGCAMNGKMTVGLNWQIELLMSLNALSCLLALSMKPPKSTELWLG